MKMASLRLVVTAWLAMIPFAASAATALNIPQLDKLEQTLHLTPQQKAQYDVAVAATKRMLMTAAILALQVKQRLQQEFARPRPDLGALADLREAIVEQTKPLRREARDEWLKLYAMLDDEQVAVLKSFIEDKFDQLGVLHELMLQLILGRPR